MNRDSAAAWQGRATGGRVTPKSSFSGHSQKPTKQQPSRLTCEMQRHVRCNVQNEKRGGHKLYSVPDIHKHQ